MYCIGCELHTAYTLMAQPETASLKCLVTYLILQRTGFLVCFLHLHSNSYYQERPGGLTKIDHTGVKLCPGFLQRLKCLEKASTVSIPRPGTKLFK